MAGKKLSLRTLFILLTILLIVPTAFMFFRNSYYDFQHARKMALAQAESILNKDKSLRIWATSHGGVYVPVDDRTPPNPNLAHLPDRDLRIGDKNLTLMNPAYMLRQIMNEHRGLYGAKSRITSLKPVNPGNAPDAWETEALEKVAREGREEIYAFVEEEDGEKLRYLSAMTVREGCLKCHGHQGYKTGDVRGGVSVTVPMDHYYEEAWKMVGLKMLAISSVILTLSLTMFFVYRKIKHDQERALEQQKIIMDQSRHAAMGEMIGAISHQMKQPLNVISMSAQALETDLEDHTLDDELIEEHCQVVLSQVRYLAETVSDFRNFFKPDKERKPFPLIRTIETGVRILDRQLQGREIALRIRGEEREVNGVANEFQQVVINIVNNAKDALSEHRKENREIVVSVEEEEEAAVVVRIADNGGGIPDEHLPRIFAPYFSTKGEQGTGIGLYMARMIVEESFRGSLRAYNENEGAVFEIRLPLR